MATPGQSSERPESDARAHAWAKNNGESAFLALHFRNEQFGQDQLGPMGQQPHQPREDNIESFVKESEGSELGRLRTAWSESSQPGVRVATEFLAALLVHQGA